MDAQVADSRPDRRIRRLSLAGLVIVLPLAIVLHSGGGVLDWLARRMASPVAVERGEEQAYGGARWRLTELTRMQGTVLAVVQFEAVVDDPALLTSGGYCLVRLMDASGRRWLPQFRTEFKVREARPELAEKQRCMSFEGVSRGQTVGMAEVYMIPESAVDLTLSLNLAEMPDKGLVFR